LSQKLWTRARVVQVAVNPSKSFSRRGLGGRRKPAGGKTSVQCPRDEKPVAFGIRMGKTAARVHENLVALSGIKSRVHMSVNAARKSACATSV
jgi:hypothetical protein